MKMHARLLMSAIAILLVQTSCKKEGPYPVLNPPRKIKFNLYTEQNFSTDNHNITFSILIRNKNKVLFDSAFATMKVKDIPGSDNKLTLEKLVPGNDQSDLSVGFVYTIENIGYSWYIDTCNAGTNYKVVDYSFR